MGPMVAVEAEGLIQAGVEEAEVEGAEVEGAEVEEAEVEKFSDQIVPKPDPRISRAENSYVQASSSRGLPKVTDPTSTTDPAPLRPAYGSQGQEVVLWANYVEMKLPSELVLYRYSIDIEPEVKGKKCEQVVRLLLEMPELVVFTRDLVTDFKSHLLSRKKLNTEKYVFNISYRAEKEDEPSAEAKPYKITVKLSGTLSVADLIDFLASTDPRLNCTEKSSIIQALNILVRHHAKLNSNLITVGSSKTFSFSSNSARADLGGGLSATRGFFSSVRAATSRILININVSHGAFYNATRLDQLIQNWLSANGQNNHRLQKFLSKLRVALVHLKERKNRAGEPIPRTKTISGLASPDDGSKLDHPPKVGRFGAGPKEVEFFLETSPLSSHPNAGKNRGTKKGKKGGGASAQNETAGSYISVYEYFEKQHNRRPNPNIPVVNLGNRGNPMYFPAEACNVLPGQTSKTALAPHQTQAMMDFAVRRPWANADSILNEGLHTVGLIPPANEVLGRFDISVEKELITVGAHVLTKPNVIYRGNKHAPIWNGGWNMKEKKFTKGAELGGWGMLFISRPGRLKNPAVGHEQNVAKGFQEAMEAAGMTTKAHSFIRSLDVKYNEDPRIDESLSAASTRVRLLVVVLPGRDPELYKRIKYGGDIKLGMHTVCMDVNQCCKHLPQPHTAYLANIALKLNLKLGGENHSVGLEKIGIISEGKTIIVGIDVTHPSPGSPEGTPSVAGMVASINKYLGQWPAILRIQESAKEMVNELGPMIKVFVSRWRDNNKGLPENILIYRDGVSEGQYAEVLAEEVKKLRAACKELYPGPDQKRGLPKVTVVIVAKRHHTRFYPTRLGEADEHSNPQPGTVVDRGVTEARTWDFFMQAHAALKGTARPAHYVVLCDEIFTTGKTPPHFKNAADVLQELTHHLCYMYGRATRSVSICTPVYYAHIACERARCYVSFLYDDRIITDSDGKEIYPEVANEEITPHRSVIERMYYL